MPAEPEATPCHVAGIMLLTLNINALELLALHLCVGNATAAAGAATTTTTTTG